MIPIDIQDSRSKVKVILICLGRGHKCFTNISCFCPNLGHSCEIFCFTSAGGYLLKEIARKKQTQPFTAQLRKYLIVPLKSISSNHKVCHLRYVDAKKGCSLHVKAAPES